MEKKNRVRIEKNDATTSHNGNILVEVESSDLKTEELKELALEIVEKVKTKRKKNG